MRPESLRPRVVPLLVSCIVVVSVCLRVLAAYQDYAPSHNDHQQVGLPLMSSGTCPEDMLWIVNEPDFCVYGIDAKARVELLMHRLGDGFNCDYKDFAAEIQDEAARVRFRMAMMDWLKQGRTEQNDNVVWPHCPPARSKAMPSTSGATSKRPPTPRPKVAPLPTRPKAEERLTTTEGCSRELLDMVLYFNASAKAGRGGLLWTGWNAEQWSEGKKCRQTSPVAGVQCVMLTTKAARFLMDHIDEIPDMHMGNFLSKLCGLKWQEELGVAYLVPPIGSFVAHESTTTPGSFLDDHFRAKQARQCTSQATSRGTSAASPRKVLLRI